MDGHVYPNTSLYMVHNCSQWPMSKNLLILIVNTEWLMMALLMVHNEWWLTMTPIIEWLWLWWIWVMIKTVWLDQG